MVIVRIIGGLGNQMFQYAAARRLAYIHNTPLKLDITQYKSYKLRKYELDNFNINAQIASENEIVKFIKIPENIFEKGIFSLIPSLQIRNNANYYKEKFYHFDEKVLSHPDNVYLSGYWHSEKYFLDIQDLLERDLTLKNPISKSFIYLSKQIKTTNSISIHIRRGDFVEKVDTKKLHGFYGAEYIQKAIAIIINKLHDAHFYIFSDDLGWVKENLMIKYPVTLIEKEKDKGDCEDLMLMSLCKHNIIVNSTFGWWGAWLNRNSEKIVVAPKKWYQEGPKDTQDLLPQSWITL